MNDLLSQSLYLINLESEQTILSAIFLEPELIKDCKLVANNFGERKHQRLFSLFKQLDEKGLPIEMISVVEEIGMANVDAIGGINYVSELIASSYSTTSFNYHQELLIEYHKKRQIAETARQSLQDIHEKTSDEIMQDVSKSHNALDDNDFDNDLGHIKEVLGSTFDEMQINRGEISGAETGFAEVDKITSGLQRQDLVIVGARPSVGKTALALNLAKNTAEKGNPSAVFSIEMKKEKIASRLISSSGNIEGDKMMNPMAKFTESDWSKTVNALGELSHLPIHIFDKPNPDMNYIFRKCRLLKKEYPDEHLVVIIDYLQLIKGDPKQKGNRTQEISEISRGLKGIARELDLTMVALSQLSRDVEKRQDKRPLLSDLRESGQIEQDADVIGLLYRDDYYNAETEEPGIIEVNVAKQRNGPTGTVKLLYVKEYSKFLNIDL